LCFSKGSTNISSVLLERYFGMSSINRIAFSTVKLVTAHCLHYFGYGVLRWLQFLQIIFFFPGGKKPLTFCFKKWHLVSRLYVPSLPVSSNLF